MRGSGHSLDTPVALRWRASPRKTVAMPLLGAARLHRCPLVVSKVDRLTRSVAFLSRLLEANVDVRFADLPQIEGATGTISNSANGRRG